MGEGGALCHGRVNTAVPVGPPRPFSITHPEAAPATVTCSYIVRHRWILGRGNLVHDTTTTKRSAVGDAWAGWGSIPVFFSLGWQVTRVSPYVRGPFPSKETRRSGEYRKGRERERARARARERERERERERAHARARERERARARERLIFLFLLSSLSLLLSHLRERESERERERKRERERACAREREREREVY